MEERLRLCQKLLDFWFAPWGAAKGAQWEFLSSDRAFTPFRVAEMCKQILDGDERIIAKVKEIC
jgi:hypothetical protein